ncbi:6-phosphogluconolactonase [Pedobacter sp. W3I1]|uniref:lactonase family protein n=1 Tax=Pedobacter sp. W3I1 TaxID=3042291 RepID=UPI0027824460|nr:lactonase family protein [Pedobacter sp. W3I1]MDQ0639955.1 6-phosphogluconolactonase [Pedobacter sp. W3I1]
MVIVVGSYSKETHAGIHLYRWDNDKNRFGNIGHITGIENPSFVSIDAVKGLIYAVTEKKETEDSELHIYQMTGLQEETNLIARIRFSGQGSCYISTDTTSKHAFITNYGSGSLTVIRLPQGNEQGVVVQQLEFKGSGPVAERQEKPHLHAALPSKDNRYLYCSDLGSDRLYRFSYRPEATLPLPPEQSIYQQLPAGSGPRHLALSPNGDRLYLITELTGEIYMFNTGDFGTGWLQRVSLLQEGYSGKTEGADIKVHPNGAYLYASNRGNANEIVVFSIERISGQLFFLQRIGAAGLSPRGLHICEQEGLLLVANEQSDNISIFGLQSDGTLKFTKEELRVPCPTCITEWREKQTLNII